MKMSETTFIIEKIEKKKGTFVFNIIDGAHRMTAWQRYSGKTPKDEVKCKIYEKLSIAEKLFVVAPVVTVVKAFRPFSTKDLIKQMQAVFREISGSANNGSHWSEAEIKLFLKHYTGCGNEGGVAIALRQSSNFTDDIVFPLIDIIESRSFMMKEGETCLPPLLRWSKAYKRGEGDQCFPDVKCYKLLEAASRSYSNNPSLSKLLLQAFSCKEIALSELAFKFREISSGPHKIFRKFMKNHNFVTYRDYIQALHNYQTRKPSELPDSVDTFLSQLVDTDICTKKKCSNFIIVLNNADEQAIDQIRSLTMDSGIGFVVQVSSQEIQKEAVYILCEAPSTIGIVNNTLSIMIKYVDNGNWMPLDQFKKCPFPRFFADFSQLLIKLQQILSKCCIYTGPALPDIFTAQMKSWNTSSLFPEE